jgi:tetratricopeptide (TPR) repeat protein
MRIGLVSILLLAFVTSAQCQQTAEDWISRGDDLTSKSFDQQTYQEGILAYQKAIDLEPTSADSWYKKGCALYYLGGIGKESYWGGYPWGNPEELTSEAIQACNDAIECFDKATVIRPNWGDPWNLKGFVLIQLGELDEALWAMDNATKIDPQNPEYWENKAFVLSKLGRNVDADIAISEAKRLSD